ncbi:MAG: serine hydrolase [Acidobacteriota bacterium]
MAHLELLRPLLAIGLLIALVAPCRLVADDRFERIDPEAAGWSPEGLAELETFLDDSGSSALLLIDDGKVVFEWGDIHRRHTVHSIRKALLSSLVGIAVDRGSLKLDTTLDASGIDDIEPKPTAAELRATVGDVLKSRSGVYHPAAAEAPGMIAARPARGSHGPGEHYYYNNWDFNVAGALVEEALGKDLYTAFLDEVARPLGMLHYRGRFTTRDGTDDAIPETDGFYQFEPEKSRFPAYHFRMSAHDLALYGMLYLRRGVWNGRRILSEEWIDASTTSYSVTNPRIGIGYGMLWKVLLETERRSAGSFFHTGVGVHMLGVYPTSKLVFVHRVATEREYEFPERNLYRIIGLVFAARQPSSKPTVAEAERGTNP